MGRRGRPSALQGGEPARAGADERPQAALTGNGGPKTMAIPAALDLRPRLLLGPGPSDAHPNVLRAMATPLLGHLDPQFLRVLDEVQEMLRAVFLTKNALTLPISGTGTAGMETALVNLLEPGDRAVICSA